MTEKCRTFDDALASISCLEELEGFTAAIRSPDLVTFNPTDAEWARIADLKIQLQRRARP